MFFSGNRYGWFEFSPFYVGAKDLDAVVSPEVFDFDIYYLLGTLGSAFSGSVKDVLNRVLLPIPNDLFKTIAFAKNKIDRSNWSSRRIGAAQLTNFTYGVKGFPVNMQKKIPVFDGGYLANLPLESLFNQKYKSNIVFVVDNSAVLLQGALLKDMEFQLKKKGYLLPNIDYNAVQTQNFSIFKSDKKNVPTVVYFSLRKDSTYSKNFDPQLEKFCSTTNFFYSKKQADLLMGLSRHVVNNNKKEIFDLIRSY